MCVARLASDARLLLRNRGVGVAPLVQEKVSGQQAGTQGTVALDCRGTSLLPPEPHAKHRTP